MSKTGSFFSDTFDDIIDEGVHDAHGLGGHTGIRVDSFQDVVDFLKFYFTSLKILDHILQRPKLKFAPRDDIEMTYFFIPVVKICITN